LYVNTFESSSGDAAGNEREVTTLSRNGTDSLVDHSMRSRYRERGLLDAPGPKMTCVVASAISEVIQSSPSSVPNADENHQLIS
jgi:hypothetical protein